MVGLSTGFIATPSKIVMDVLLPSLAPEPCTQVAEFLQARLRGDRVHSLVAATTTAVAPRIVAALMSHGAHRCSVEEFSPGP
jgi:hypothetical protein